ncbi:MAG: hypothetical protein ACR2PL_02085 [Dehalococcoidia bacterium]
MSEPRYGPFERSLRSLEELRRRERRATDRAHEESVAWHATVDQRLKGLDEAIAEIKGRLNGLTAIALGAIVTQVILRLVGHA